MGAGFNKDFEYKKTPKGFSGEEWKSDNFHKKQIPPVDNTGKNWSGKKDGNRKKFDFSRIPIGAIVTVALIVAVGVLLWTYRDLISDFLIRVLSWVIIIAVVVVIWRLIFRRRRKW